jgi:hypothetical protein
MLTIISSIIGFVGGFVPDILKYFKQKQDNAHEIEVMKLQMDAQAQLHTQRLEEINANADIAESQALYKSAELKPSGVGWVDAILYFWNGTVRPTVTYAFVGLYIATKVAQMYGMMKAQVPWDKALLFLWTEFDASALMLVLSYYFGARMASKVFKLK